jgi:hypothetical protein
VLIVGSYQWRRSFGYTFRPCLHYKRAINRSETALQLSASVKCIYDDNRNYITVRSCLTQQSVLHCGGDTVGSEAVSDGLANINSPSRSLPTIFLPTFLYLVFPLFLKKLGNVRTAYQFWRVHQNVTYGLCEWPRNSHWENPQSEFLVRESSCWYILWGFPTQFISLKKARVYSHA